MKILIKISLLLLLPAFVAAQTDQKHLDSLRMALRNAENDTIRMDIYIQLGLFYNEINPDSSVFFLDQGLPIAQKLKLKLNEAAALENRGYMLIQLGNYPKSLESLLQALKIAEDPASEKNTWNLSLGQTPRNVRIKKLGDINLVMGHLYGATANTDKQISSYLKAMNLAESVQDTGLQKLANLNLGGVYAGLGKLDSALFFEQTALTLYSKLSAENRKYEGGVLSSIAEIYQQKGNINLAMDALLKAVKINKEQNNLNGLGGDYLFLSHLYQNLKKPDSSLLYANKGLETFKAVRQQSGIAGAYNLLSSIYSEQNKADSAFVYLKLGTSINDSLYNVERKNLLAVQNIRFDEQLRLKKLEEEKIQTQTKIRTYAMLAVLGVFLVIGIILYRNNRQKQKANKVLESTLTNLKSTQSQLIQSEKMASLGELTAGIAHEIQNPLNFVNNFSEVNSELADELKSELATGNLQLANEIAADIKDNSEKINHHGKRAGDIVKGMLQHSRSSTGVKEPTDINALADEYLRLSYHGLRAKDKDFNATMNTDFDTGIGKINIIPQDIGRVLLNLYNNAFYAVTEKAKNPQPLKGSKEYEPTVAVSTKAIKSPSGGLGVLLTVKDNGNGIPQKVIDKIFQPFFTTKPTGEGTGLGLSLSYDIVKAQGGEIKVETNEGEGSEFIIQLPAN